MVEGELSGIRGGTSTTESTPLDSVGPLIRYLTLIKGTGCNVD